MTEFFDLMLKAKRNGADSFKYTNKEGKTNTYHRVEKKNIVVYKNKKGSKKSKKKKSKKKKSKKSSRSRR